MKEIIEEKNNEECSNFVLSQPHDANYLSAYFKNGRKSIDKKKQVYSPKIVRKDTNLSLKKKISIFKKFEEIIDGGIIFNSICASNESNFEEHINKLLDSKLSAFSISNSNS